MLFTLSLVRFTRENVFINRCTDVSSWNLYNNVIMTILGEIVLPPAAMFHSESLRVIKNASVNIWLEFRRLS